MDSALQELIEFVKSASPVIWQALYKQVYVEALSFLIWAIGLAFVAIMLVRFAKFANSKKVQEEEYGKYTDWGVVSYASYVSASIVGLIAFALLVSAIKWASNPEFYAIRFILESLGSGL